MPFEWKNSNTKTLKIFIAGSNTHLINWAASKLLRNLSTIPHNKISQWKHCDVVIYIEKDISDKERKFSS